MKGAVFSKLLFELNLSVKKVTVLYLRRTKRVHCFDIIF